MMIQLQKVVEFGKEGDKEEKVSEHEKRHSKFFLFLYFPYPEINIFRRDMVTAIHLDF